MMLGALTLTRSHPTNESSRAIYQDKRNNYQSTLKLSLRVCA